MSLPTQPADLPYPDGNSWSIRSGADHVRSTIDQLRTARTAALRIDDIASGAHWRGDAFDAFTQIMERHPLPAAIDHASDRMEQAATQLDWYAARFDRNVETIRWCRARLAVLGLEPGVVPDELVGEVERIRWDAERAWEDHRAALRSVADLFDFLDDEPTFAKPPPSNWDKVSGAVGNVVAFAGNVVIGTGEAVFELVELGAEIGLYVNPLTGPFKMRELWENRDQFLAVLDYAWNEPGDFALGFGKALIDLETWREDGIGRWIGHRIPDLVLAVATGGAGTVGRGAAVSVRGFRGARAASKATDLLGVSRHFAPVGKGVDDVTTVAAHLGSTGYRNRVNRLGATADRLDRKTDGGAFARTDTTLGRIATRLDANPGLEMARQVPGRLSDEIAGFTELPSRFLHQRFPDNTLLRDLGPIGQSRIDSLLTGGMTSRLGVIDGLLVGAPALSPQARQAMGSILGVRLLDDLAGMVGMGAALSADATAAGPG